MPTTYERTVQRLDDQVALFRRWSEERPRSWSQPERLAGVYAARAQLTGSYDDYQAAEAALAEAFGRAGPVGGPLMARAHLHFSLHRLQAAAADLDRIEAGAVPPRVDHAGVLALRGDIAFHSGHLDAARQAYGESDRLRPTPSSAFRLAQLFWKEADFPRAERLMDEALRRTPASSSQLLAFLHLQQGLMDLDRGRLDRALAHYRQADREMSGWWMVQEHVAEIDALSGHREQAAVAYRDLIARTDNPEFMDALAEILQTRGERDQATTLRDRAGAIYEARLRQLPEATYGHAIQHFLATDAARAVTLAEANLQLRPGGEARTLLAQAYARAGRRGDAIRAIQGALRTGWSTARTHATAAALLEASGRAAEARRERDRAEAINPRAMEGVEWIGEAVGRRADTGVSTARTAG